MHPVDITYFQFLTLAGTMAAIYNSVFSGIENIVVEKRNAGFFNIVSAGVLTILLILMIMSLPHK